MNDNELQSYCLETARRAHTASRELARSSGAERNAFLLHAAGILRERTEALIEANARDLETAPQFGLTSAQTDRLRLTDDRIESMARGLEEIAAFPDPVGEIIEGGIRPNGLEIRKVRVPLGVVFFVYESRPNVTADAAGICVKSGNAVILRGGKEAAHSSQAIVELLFESLDAAGLPRDAIQWVKPRDREAVGQFLRLDEYIDVAIPRGGESLIRRVAEEATMPVIKHFAGNCHLYIDQSADPEMARAITVNAKCQRPGVCNACETLLVHQSLSGDWLAETGRQLEQHGVEIRGDEATRRVIPEATPVTRADYESEFLDWVLAVKVVSSLDEAIEHINTYGSKHSDAIVTRDLAQAQEFARRVDTAAVFINASTRFHDGGEFGLGAEIGISTDKFHARGPCGVRELTSYKYIVTGRGQIRQ